MENQFDHQESPEQQELPLINLPQVLKQAREDAGKTIEDIADSLRLKSEVVKELENDATYTPEKLTTFMRGYLRSYAKLLNIPEERIKTGLEDLGLLQHWHTPAKPKPVRISPKLNTRPHKMTTYLVVIILVVLVLIWRHMHHQKANHLLITPEQSPQTTTQPVVIAQQPEQPLPPQATTPPSDSGEKAAHPAVWVDPDFVASSSGSREQPTVTIAHQNDNTPTTENG